MNDHEILDDVPDDDLEEVEPEAWSTDRVDEDVEGIEGYEEVEEDDVAGDPLDNEPDLVGETDQA